VGEERFDILGTEVFGVLLLMEKDKPADPMGVGLFGAQSVILAPERFADLLEERSWG
jgi:hypothetical protein